MNIESLCLCRSSDKVFEEVLIGGLPEGHLLAPIVSVSETGTSLPFRIYPIDERPEYRNSLLFVYPLLPLRSATFVVGEYDKGGSLLETYSFELDYEKAKWRSRLNYRVNRSRCVRLKECPRGKWPAGKARIILNTAVISPWHIVIRGAMRIPSAATEVPRVVCSDKWLNRIDSDFTLLNPLDESQPSCGYRDVDFSLRIPLDKKSIIANDVFLALVSDVPSIEVTASRRLSVKDCKAMVKASSRLFLDIDCNSEYQQWRELTRATAEEVRGQSNVSFPISPKFSIVVPLFKTPRRLFMEMVDSVCRQSYRNWELILVNASPEDSELGQSIQEVLADDQRISLVELERNFGISLNTNAGIRAAGGDFVCFFDHDDLLEPDLLFEYVKAINEHPETDALFCDEDKLTPDGFHVDPKFKPDFSLDYLCDNNYICHLMTVRTELLRSLPENTEEFDGAQDHNLMLHVAERARYIHHVRRILYHWRMSETSTAGNPDTKPYATLAGIRAVQAHFDRVGIPAIVGKSRRNFTYAIRYLAPEERPLVSIVISSNCGSTMLERCMDALNASCDYPNLEIIVVRTGNPSEASSFGSIESRFAGRYPVSLVDIGSSSTPQEAMNRGAACAHGDFLLFMHDDICVEAPFDLGHLVGAANRSDIGAVGCRLFYPDDCLQHAGYRIGRDGRIGDFFKGIPRMRWGLLCLADSQRNVTAVSSACMMVSSKVFSRVGGFDESLWGEFGDVDLCLRLAEKGLQTLFTPEVNAVHYECSPHEKCGRNAVLAAAEAENASRFSTKWDDRIESDDPFYGDTLEEIMATSYEACLL